MIGARLKQARLLAGMTQQQLADAVQEAGFRITKQAISKYETGKSFPSAPFLLHATAALNVPVTYLHHQPELDINWLAFRCKSDFGARRKQSLKSHAADIAELQIELHTLLYRNSPPRILRPKPVADVLDAEERATELRDYWEVGDRPLDTLVQVAESQGVVVIEWHADTEGFDGLSGWCGDYPITVINQKRPSDRIRFSLAHELGHLVMDTSSLENRAAEKLAHRFAGALLLTKEQARREIGENRSNISWGELKLLKRKYGLSLQAWLRRAKDLAIIDDRTHTKLCKELSARGWRKVEPG